MTNPFSCEPYLIIRGDALQALRQLQTVDCVVTSPPYFNQRSYGESSAELGKEQSVTEYIANLVKVFRTIPLAPWGSVWVNIGDKRGKRGELLNIPERFYADIAEERCLQAQRLWSACEAKNASAVSPGTSPASDSMPDHMSCYLDSVGM
jgi:hypothetical protein